MHTHVHMQMPLKNTRSDLAFAIILLSRWKHQPELSPHAVTFLLVPLYVRCGAVLRTL